MTVSVGESESTAFASPPSDRWDWRPSTVRACPNTDYPFELFDLGGCILHLFTELQRKIERLHDTSLHSCCLIHLTVLQSCCLIDYFSINFHCRRGEFRELSVEVFEDLHRGSAAKVCVRCSPLCMQHCSEYEKYTALYDFLIWISLLCPVRSTQNAFQIEVKHSASIICAAGSWRSRRPVWMQLFLPHAECFFF